LIGPIDDLGPLEYEPLALEIFGAGLPPTLADPPCWRASRRA
jgi:hypothetical protein